MSKFALELLDGSHDRASFSSGLDTVDRFLKETARGHTEKGVSLTRVLVNAEAVAPKRVRGYFTLTPCMAQSMNWPGSPKGLPKMPVGMVLLGRLAVDMEFQGHGHGALLLALARGIAYDALKAAGGIGMVVDAANEKVVAFYARFGFRRTTDDSLRLFLPTASLI